MIESIPAPALVQIEAMREIIRPYVMQTPLVPFAGQEGDDAHRLHLKLENLQWTGAFKNRTAAALLHSSSREALAAGVCTASSGNFGIALSALAAQCGIVSTIIVPDTAPAGKIERLRRTGARVVQVSQGEWWQTILTHQCGAGNGLYLDAVADTRAMAGSGSIGVEILEQSPDVDTVFVPFGGGGLLCGIAAAIKAIRPQVRVIACESELATPLTAAFRAGRPVTVPCRAGFISGIGAASVLPVMWPLLQGFVDDVVVVSLRDTAAAVRDLLLQVHVVAEGAGAVSVAAARTGKVRGRCRVCVVSGGNIDANTLAPILAGGFPQPDASEDGCA
jgi:threonine dehydratase